MKNLFFLMVLLFFINCKTEEKNQDCGSIVTQNVSLPSDKKSSFKSIPVSYYNCEYVVIMPQSSDSLILQKYLADNKFEQINGFNSNTQLYRHGTTGITADPINPNGPRDTVIVVKGPPPPPPFDKIFYPNIVIPNVRGELTSLFEIIAQPRIELKK